MKVTLVIVAVVAALLVSVVVASEVQSSGTVRSRDEIMKCAQDWCDKKIPYCQCNGPEECCGSCPHCPKYRCDCSGYVSFCLGLSYGYVTSTLHEVTHPISQDELQRGDIMLCASDHVVFFGGWTDGSKTNYIAYQEPGCHTTGPHYAFKSVVPYPFNWNPTCFLPYRLNGLGAEAVHADGTCEHNMATKEDLMEAFFNPSSFPLKHAKEGLEASRKIKEHQGSLKF